MTARETLKQYFGYDEFRSGQETLIDGIMAGRDVLGIMPTGAGKSLCFQIPALMMGGVTLIVSPLISLMKDQVNALTQSGAAAAYINTSLTQRQIEKALWNARGGAYKLIYVAPERLTTPEFMSFARSMKISMLTVDEAHCISQWGQDFRPTYSQIPAFIAGLPERPVVSAFTATATPRVREDIVSLLRLRNPQILLTGFDRKNLFFDVQKPKNRYAALTAFLDERKGRSGIVYCGTRKIVEEVCGKLQADGYNASRYHAGLMDRERHDNQDDFLYDRAQIMVATNAFGMGIDKSNVSFVVHYTMPKDIESYYQEAGRAGRDGSPAECVLFYNAKDVHTIEWMIDNDDAQYPDPETEMMLKERSRKRLREMTFYSTTTNCLRAFILKYFGEAPPDNCGNCGNCNMNFDAADITVDAQQFLSCVARMNERFGSRLVIDVLRGNTNDKVERFELNKLSTFGINKKRTRQLREILEFLVAQGYLVKSSDEYRIIRLGRRANEVLRDGARVYMKQPKAKAPANRAERAKRFATENAETDRAEMIDTPMELTIDRTEMIDTPKEMTVDRTPMIDTPKETTVDMAAMTDTANKTEKAKTAEEDRARRIAAARAALERAKRIAMEKKAAADRTAAINAPKEIQANKAAITIPPKETPANTVMEEKAKEIERANKALKEKEREIEKANEALKEKAKEIEKAMEALKKKEMEIQKAKEALKEKAKAKPPRETRGSAKEDPSPGPHDRAINRLMGKFVDEPVDKTMFDALRKLRREIADEQRVPAYIIFNDSTLSDMCVKLPKTKAELAKVSGVGGAKLEKFGDRFLSVIAGHLRSR
jgi:ATP-dependent DNA helicase RecQ